MKIYVGAGPDAATWSQDGWTCNDVVDFPGVTLVGPCWKLDVGDGVADEVLAKGMFEHLTYREAQASLVEWRRVLRVGGHVTVEVPDAEEYLRAYFDMLRDPASQRGEAVVGCQEEPDDLGGCDGIERWLRRALWGWQRWPGDEHRSGWTERLFAFYLKKYFSETYDIRRMAYSYEQDELGYCRVKHLWGRAWKM